MGCLKVNIVPVSGHESVSVSCGNDLAFSLSVIKKKICKCMNFILRSLNELLFSVNVVNDSFLASIGFACSKPKIDIGIVCMTDLDTEYYLRVLDGYLITLDGCFVKVQKG
jgi:hypothetical protein